MQNDQVASVAAAALLLSFDNQQNAYGPQVGPQTCAPNALRDSVDGSNAANQALLREIETIAEDINQQKDPASVRDLSAMIGELQSGDGLFSTLGVGNGGYGDYAKRGCGADLGAHWNDGRTNDVRDLLQRIANGGGDGKIAEQRMGIALLRDALNGGNPDLRNQIRDLINMNAVSSGNGCNGNAYGGNYGGNAYGGNGYGGNYGGGAYGGNGYGGNYGGNAYGGNGYGGNYGGGAYGGNAYGGNYDGAYSPSSYDTNGLFDDDCGNNDDCGDDGYDDTYGNRGGGGLNGLLGGLYGTLAGLCGGGLAGGLGGMLNPAAQLIGSLLGGGHRAGGYGNGGYGNGYGNGGYNRAYDDGYANSGNNVAYAGNAAGGSGFRFANPISGANPPPILDDAANYNGGYSRAYDNGYANPRNNVAYVDSSAGGPGFRFTNPISGVSPPPILNDAPNYNGAGYANGARFAGPSASGDGGSSVEAMLLAVARKDGAYAPGSVAYEGNNGFDFRSWGDPHITTKLDGKEETADRKEDNPNFNTVYNTNGGKTRVGTISTPEKNGVTFNDQVNIHHSGRDAWHLNSDRQDDGTVKTVLSNRYGDRVLGENAAVTQDDGSRISVKDGKVTVEQKTTGGGTVTSIISDNGQGLDIEEKGTGRVVLGGQAARQAAD